MTTEHNIFVIGRLADDEDQLTEMLAWLLSVVPETAKALSALAIPDLDIAGGAPKVTTQYVIPNGRLDAILELEDSVVVIESKEVKQHHGGGRLRRQFRHPRRRRVQSHL